eukprot:2103531-Pleurochrysis_carterae.AAC.1
MTTLLQTVLGSCMQRMQDGIVMKLPDTTVSSGFSDFLVIASCISILDDIPAAAWLTGLNQSVAPDVKSICRLCNCCQVLQANLSILYPAKQAKSFLPWTRAGSQI